MTKLSERTKEEIRFWNRAKQIIKKGYGADCTGRDLDDFPELKQDERCASCKATLNTK